MITNKDLFYVRMLTKISANMDNGLRCKHASVLVVDKAIVSFGLNSQKSHPAQKKFSRPIKYIIGASEAAPYNFLHAEIDCLKNIHSIKSKRSTLYVVRVDNHGNLANSRPCEGCFSKVKSVRNLHRIVYSVQGGIVEEFIN